MPGHDCLYDAKRLICHSIYIISYIFENHELKNNTIVVLLKNMDGAICPRTLLFLFLLMSIINIKYQCDMKLLR